MNKPGIQPSERYALNDPSVPPVKPDKEANSKEQLNKSINKSKLDQLEKDNTKELEQSMPIDNNIDLQSDDDDDNDIGESIVYYSPSLKRYIVEHIAEIL